MSNELEIRTLTERFFDGETSLAEEQRLYELYRSADELPADLLPLREMMLDVASLQNEREVRSVKRDMSRIAESPEKECSHSTLQTPHVTLHTSHVTLITLAASLLLLIGVATVWYQQARQNECVAYVYGERVTDRAVVMQEMHSAMASISDDEAADMAEAQLRELFE